jgi:hypothetical protein
VDDGLDEAENGAWTMVWMKPKTAAALLSKRVQKQGSPNLSDQCLQRRIRGHRLRKEA